VETKDVFGTVVGFTADQVHGGNTQVAVTVDDVKKDSEVIGAKIGEIRRLIHDTE
jgi:hypothetical protein